MFNFSVAGKKLLIIGGNSYIGSEVTRRAVSLGAHVTCVSRSGGPRRSNTYRPEITWVAGDIMKPYTFEKELENSDAVIHTVGVLSDTRITMLRNAKDEGSYETLNRNSARAIGDALNHIGGKKMVYVSTAQGGGFMSKFIENKQEGADFIASIQQVKTTVLRPGYIYSLKYRPWRIPLKYGKDFYQGITSAISNIAGENPSLKEMLRRSEIQHAVHVDAVALVALLASCSSEYEGKVIESKEIQSIYEQFAERVKEDVSKHPH